MTRIQWIGGIGALALATIAVVSVLGRPAPDTAVPTETSAVESSGEQVEVDSRRRFDALLAGSQRSASEDEALLARSDAMRSALEERGEEDIGAAIRTRLRDVEVDEASARAWFEAHREVFGARSFEQSRHSVERLIAIERVREDLDPGAEPTPG